METIRTNELTKIERVAAIALQGLLANPNVVYWDCDQGTKVQLLIESEVTQIAIEQAENLIEKIQEKQSTNESIITTGNEAE